MSASASVEMPRNFWHFWRGAGIGCSLGRQVVVASQMEASSLPMERRRCYRGEVAADESLNRSAVSDA